MFDLKSIIAFTPAKDAIGVWVELNRRYFLGAAVICTAGSTVLADEPGQSYLMVRSDRNARVAVDGQRVGDVVANTFTRFSVTPGQHVVEIVASDGSARWDGVVTVPVGEKTLVQPTLTPADPLVGVRSTFADGTGATYRTTRVGRLEWFAENLRREYPESYPPNGIEGNVANYGRLYFPSTAMALVPGGWRLPTKADFESLLALYPAETRYADLMPGGRSGFDASLAGGISRDGNTPPGGFGVYWTSTRRQSAYLWTAYFQPPGKVEIGYAVRSDFQRYSARYCRDV